MTYECTYCGKTLSNKYILKTHQQTTQYCLKIQQNITEYKCKGCKRTFQNTASYDGHQVKCLNLLKQQLKEKDLIIKELQSKLENCTIAAIKSNRSTSASINVQVNNFAPITNKVILDSLKYLTIDYIKQGAIGYAKYALKYPFKDKIICTDYARRKFKYKNEKGEIVSDPNGTKLCKRFFSLIERRNAELIEPHINSPQNELWNVPLECGDNLDDEELEEKSQSMGDLSNQLTFFISNKNQFRYSIKGDITDLQTKFIKYIAKHTMK